MAPARKPGASFAPLSPAPATRSIKAPLTEHWCRCNRFWKESAECPSRPSSPAAPVRFTNRTPHQDGSSRRSSSVRCSAASTLCAAFRGTCWTSGKRKKIRPLRSRRRPREILRSPPAVLTITDPETHRKQTRKISRASPARLLTNRAAAKTL